MGVPVGSVDKVEPAGDKMKVTFHYPSKYKVPADASAVILNPSLVASRNIQLEPPYNGGPVLTDNTVIPIERTQVPVEWDDLRDSIGKTVSALGPTPEQPKGPFGDAIESLANGLAGKGDAINKSLNSLSTALTAINDSRGETFAIVGGLATFLNALQINEQQLVSLNGNLAQITSQPDAQRPSGRRRGRRTQRTAAHPAQIPRRQRPGADPRRRQPGGGDHSAGPARHRQRPGDLPARVPDVRGQRQHRLPPQSWRAVPHSGGDELRQSTRTRSAARFRPAADWAIRIPPSCARST